MKFCLDTFPTERPNLLPPSPLSTDPQHRRGKKKEGGQEVPDRSDLQWPIGVGGGGAGRRSQPRPNFVRFGKNGKVGQDGCLSARRRAQRTDGRAEKKRELRVRVNTKRQRPNLQKPFAVS